MCNHEWSFLEGHKKHSHTLKAGRHLFPFQLQVGGSLPSSLAAGVHSGAWIAYKLRAHAVRPGLSHNLQVTCPIYIIRSFAPEALEYQQTLEIENTWPEKVMYSIVLPHKAWAAGDKLTAIVKFSPLTKGTRILKVKTTINETVKVISPQGHQECTHIVSTAKHEIIDGKAVDVDSPPLSPPHTNSGPTSSTPPFSASQPTESPSTVAGSGTSDLSTERSEANEFEGPESNSDVVTHITILIPPATCTTHSLEPVVITHRVRWSVLIGNLDGHTSELRCSLPVHLLDYRLLDEARSHTSATRRLLLGTLEEPPEEQEDMELPSYTAHVRDRVANMFLSPALARRVTNPWLSSGISPTQVVQTGRPATPLSHPHSELSTPIDVSHLPFTPDLESRAPLDWVNSELLLSLSQNTATPFLQDHSPPDSNPTSQPESRTASRRQSRPSSRTGSPERVTPLGGNVGVTSGGGPNETYMHGATNASWMVHGLYQMSMKPFTGRSAPSWLPTRSHSHLNFTPTANSEPGRTQQGQRYRMQSLDTEIGSALLHRAFTEVPDYAVASRGFLGGVPPLSSMHGLPSYEETERS